MSLTIPSSVQPEFIDVLIFADPTYNIGVGERVIQLRFKADTYSLDDADISSTVASISARLAGTYPGYVVWHIISWSGGSLPGTPVITHQPEGA